MKKEKTKQSKRKKAELIIYIIVCIAALVLSGFAIFTAIRIDREKYSDNHVLESPDQNREDLSQDIEQPENSENEIKIPILPPITDDTTDNTGVVPSKPDIDVGSMTKDPEGGVLDVEIEYDTKEQDDAEQ